MSGKSFWGELQRRNVHRAAVFYAGAAWLLVQIATQVFPFFDIPNSTVRLVVLAVLIGFPFAMAFSWFYEWTPAGIQRESEIDHGDRVPEASGRKRDQKLDRAITAVLGLAVAVLLLNQFVLRRGLLPAASESATSTLPDQSIAVLPLANESGDKDQQFFSDGLSEDLITALSQFAGLKVIGRGSSFQFRDSTEDPKTIRARIGVAHLLEGSVRRIGDTVRIRTELVTVADGHTLWSQHYDRPYADLFKLQDEIASAVATALKARLLDSSGAVEQTDRPQSGNLDAYSAFLRGQFYAARFNGEDAAKAISWFEHAIELDPNYAHAHAALATAWHNSAGNFLTGAAVAAARTRAEAELERALTLQPDLAAAHALRARMLGSVKFDHAGAEAEARRAVRLAPNDVAARFSLAEQLGATGRQQEAVDLLKAVEESDPLSTTVKRYRLIFAAGIDRLDLSEQLGRAAVEIQPRDYLTRYYLVMIRWLRGDASDALAIAAQNPSADGNELTLGLARQVGTDRAAGDAAIRQLIDTSADNAAFQIAEIYGLRKQADEVFVWLDRAVQNHDPGLHFLLSSPALKAYRGDARFAAICRQTGVPSPASGSPP